MPRPGRGSSKPRTSRPTIDPIHIGERAMLALQKVAAASGLDLREVPPPARPGSAEVIIKVEATGICGTDVHIAEWTSGYEDRKSTRLNSSHANISYAVFCLKKKKKQTLLHKRR